MTSVGHAEVQTLYGMTQPGHFLNLACQVQSNVDSDVLEAIYVRHPVFCLDMSIFTWKVWAEECLFRGDGARGLRG